MENLQTVIEKMRISNEEVIKSRKNIQELVEKQILLEDAGFIERAFDLNADIAFERIMARFGKPILMKIPEKMRARTFYQDAYELADSIYNTTCYPIRVWKEKTGFLSSKERGVYLFEVSPDVFIGDVPERVLKATIEAQKLGLRPKVWFVSDLRQYYESVRMRIGLDPAVVGYIITRQSSRNVREMYRSDIAVLIGIWGKDIEQISEVFEK